jgi:hypothetical protein
LKNKSFASKLSIFIENSVAIYLWVYLFSMIALGIKSFRTLDFGQNCVGFLPGLRTLQGSQGMGAFLLAFVGSVFCIILLISLGIKTFLISITVPLLGFLLKPLWFVSSRK